MMHHLEITAQQEQLKKFKIFRNFNFNDCKQLLSLIRGQLQQKLTKLVAKSRYNIQDRLNHQPRKLYFYLASYMGTEKRRGGCKKVPAFTESHNKYIYYYGGNTPTLIISYYHCTTASICLSLSGRGFVWLNRRHCLRCGL